MADLFDTARDTHDRYYTPRYVAESFTRWLRVPPAAAVLEPSVGGGAWVRALREGGHHGMITGVDIDDHAAGLNLVDHPFCREPAPARADAERALSESNWDVDAAMDWLRSKTPMRR